MTAAIRSILEQTFRDLQKVTIVACGTSWHAGLVAEYLIEDFARIPVEVEYASELRYRNPETGELDGPYIPIDFAANAEMQQLARFLGFESHRERDDPGIRGVLAIVGFDGPYNPAMAEAPANQRMVMVLRS